MTRAVRYLAFVASAGAIAIVTAAARSEPGARGAAIVTVMLTVELIVRFRYVFSLLEWPPSPGRMTLLAAFWMGLIGFAWQVSDTHRWGIAASLLFAVGVAIETHNLVTRQWDFGGDAFRRSVRNDIRRGIAAAAFAAIATLVVARLRPDWMVPFIGALVVADVLRFTEMVLRLRRLSS